MLGITLCLLFFTPPTLDVDLSLLAPEASIAISRQQENANESASAWLKLAMLYHAHGLTDHAITSYRYSEQQSPSSKTRYLLSTALAEKGLYEDALAIAQSIQQYSPSLWRQGYWYMDLGDTTKAATVFRSAIEQNATSVPAIIGLARVHIADGNPGEAIVLLDDIVSRGGEHPYLDFLLGTAHRRAGNREKAMKFLATSTNGPPRWEDAWYEEMLSHQKGYAAEFSRAIALIDSGNKTGARTALEALQKQYPKDTAVLNNLATVYLQLQQLKLAEETLQKSMRWDPTYAPAQITMGYVQQAKGNLDLALAYAKKAIELKEGMSAGHALAGKVSFQKGAMASAVKYFSTAIDLGNSDPSIREMLGMVLLNSRRPAEAIKQFDLVLQTVASVRSISGKAIATALLGKADEALEQLAQARVAYPNNQELENTWQTVLKIKGRQ